MVKTTFRSLPIPDMENAVDELKEVADEITLSNENDGIAHTLYEKIPALKEIIV